MYKITNYGVPPKNLSSNSFMKNLFTFEIDKCVILKKDTVVFMNSSSSVICGGVEVRYKQHEQVPAGSKGDT